MTEHTAASLGNRILALDTDGDTATAVCIDVRQAIESRDREIGEMRELLTEARPFCQTSLRRRIDAALERKAE